MFVQDFLAFYCRLTAPLRTKQIETVSGQCSGLVARSTASAQTTKKCRQLFTTELTFRALLYVRQPYFENLRVNFEIYNENETTTPVLVIKPMKSLKNY